MHNVKGNIFNIQRFSTSDGPGIRTVAFLKGCPLDCAWCHNPESKKSAPEIFFSQDVCIGCKMCETLCEKELHSFTDGCHKYDRSRCSACGKCTELCHSDALRKCGEEKDIDEITKTVLRDLPFYEESGGGVTLSGGEPLMQFDFSLAMLKKAKENGLHTAVETSGYTKRDLSELCRYVDLWLYDIKLFDEEEHIKYTGVSNRVILKNLFYLDSIGAKTVLRCPAIPDVNMNREHFEKIAETANRLKNVTEINIEPYHPLGISKAEQLCKVQGYRNDKFAEKSDVEFFADIVRSKTFIETLVI